MRGDQETIGERFDRDRASFLPLPQVPYEACEKRAGRVNSTSLVRYRCNDYSVPTAYGHREVLVKGYVHEVVIACGSEVIARHRRSYEREDMVFDPLHYLALLEQKTRALDHDHMNSNTCRYLSTNRSGRIAATWEMAGRFRSGCPSRSNGNWMTC